MKTKLLFFLMLFVAFSCKKESQETETSSTPDQIKSQVKVVADSLFSGCEQVDAAKVLSTAYGSSDFVYLFNGTTKTYQEFSAALAAVYDQMQSQVVTLVNEKYAILDNATVLYTSNCTFLQHYKDGHDTLIDPVAMMLVFRNINSKWKWVYGVESYK